MHSSMTPYTCLRSLTATQQQDEEVQRVVSLHGLLESCRFREVWGEEGGVGEVTEHIANFSGQIRQCMWIVHMRTH